MNRKLWGLTLAMVATIGCSLTRSDPLPNGVLDRLDPSRKRDPNSPFGAMVAPKRNTLKIMIPNRPVDDPVLGEAIWRVADEQFLEPELRHRLESNGLRAGIVTGSLPPEVEAILDQELPPPKRIDPVVYAQPDEERMLIPIGPTDVPEQASLFFLREGVAVGKPYERPKGVFRITAYQDSSDDAVELRIVPEIHHGPVRNGYAPAPETGDPFEQQQFIFREGQKEESLRELTMKVPLRPGQVLVLGCWPERPRSLGHFMLTEPEAKSDRLLCKVVLIWATRSVGNEIPWVEPVATPKHLRPIDPSELDAPGPDRK